MSSRSDSAARPDPRLIGNRIWIVRTPDGDVLQKLYAPHSRGLPYWGRLLVERLARIKTPTSVRSRFRTEREMLAAWRAAGCDVPAVLNGAHPELVHPRVTILEYVRGPLLGKRLLSGRLGPEERDALLRRFAEGWGRRHALAIERGDARLVQEHGSVLHVIVSGNRLVTIDLEQGFRPRRDVRPLVEREIVAYIRSLAKGATEDGFRRDLASLVAGYPDRTTLEAVVRDYVESPRLVWRLDRRLRRERRALGKYRSLEILRDVLAAS